MFEWDVPECQPLNSGSSAYPEPPFCTRLALGFIDPRRLNRHLAEPRRVLECPKQYDWLLAMKSQKRA